MNDRDMVTPGNQFASDNTSGLCWESLDRLARANGGHDVSYGGDHHTAQASDAIRDFFEQPQCEVFFVFNGTAANALALAALCQSYHSVIAHESAHIETDECGAPEFFSNGTKLLLAKGKNGKMDESEVERLITKRSDIHYPRPRVLSITQSTELGTVYSLEETHCLTALAKRHGLKVHMDGARLGQALAALNCAPKELTWQAGIDVLCMGFIKSGFSLGEAVVFFNPDMAAEFDYRCKQAGQLASKMRFISAPLLAAFEDDLYVARPRHAHTCAVKLAAKLIRVPALYPIEANAVFLELPDSAIASLRAKGWKFSTSIGGGARLVTSWATTDAEIEALSNDINLAIGQDLD